MMYSRLCTNGLEPRQYLPETGPTDEQLEANGWWVVKETDPHGVKLTTLTHIQPKQ